MAGAGTAALELLEDAGIVDTLVTPVGGGGLIAGSATIARALGVRRVVGVEPAAGDDWRQSLAAGERVRIDVPRTIADGLQTNEPGRLTWEVGSRLVDEIVTVSDEQIVEAMRFAFERLKLVIEPSGAVGIAAVREGLVSGGRIGVIVSGGQRRRRALRRAARSLTARCAATRARSYESLNSSTVSSSRSRETQPGTPNLCGSARPVSTSISLIRRVNGRSAHVSCRWPSSRLADAKLDAAEAMSMHGDARPTSRPPR